VGELPDVIAQHQHAAELARRAGFDGIEVHGANGYLLDEFLRDGSNRRTDEYGGTAENRMRLLNEVLDAVTAVWPAERVGLRLSPESGYNSMSDSDPQNHFEYFCQQLSLRGLAYLHVIEGDMLTPATSGEGHEVARSKRSVDYRALRAKFAGVYIANNGYDRARASAAVQEGHADLVSFGAPFLANPDLVRRFREDLALNVADPATYYGGDEAGYNDYPAYSGTAA
jgi:N-ethylmaleimide reductase